MNKTVAASVELAKAIVGGLPQTEVDVAICPTYVALESVGKAVVGSKIILGAQNMHNEASGAYTGEISGEMLQHVGVKMVILGHSERRAYFGETDAFINKKLHAVLKFGMTPILCVGETLQEREAGKTLEVVSTQLRGGLKDMDAEVVIAYEPVWAIGTGKTATPEMAQAVHAAIRKLLHEVMPVKADTTRILYGGSMKPDNAEALMQQADIDGGLIGGAALDAVGFLKIVAAAK